MRRRRRSFFITFEGPEGSGKSSQSRWLVSSLRRAGCPVTFLRDPGSTALGRRLRNALLQTSAPLSPLAEALLFIGGRVQLVEERIQSALQRRHIVICDRFHDSTVAYQGFGGRLEVAWLDRIGREAIHGVMPALTVLLDIPTDQAFARLHRSRDRMERKAMAFHRRVRRGYLVLAKRDPGRFIVIDASASPEAVRAEVAAVITPRLRARAFRL